MCFSETASFITFGVTGAIGLAAVARAKGGREVPLAAIPVFFAVQQGVEGLIWRTLPLAGDGPASSPLTYLFLLLAEVFWPVFAPLAVLIAEPRLKRRGPVALCLVAGVAVAYYFMQSLMLRPHLAEISGGHIVYSGDPDLPYAVALAYLAATGGALLISSLGAVRPLGGIVTLGSIAAYLFYRDAFVSVWCFFAAAGSVVIYAHFERARRLRKAAV